MSRSRRPSRGRGQRSQTRGQKPPQQIRSFGVRDTLIMAAIALIFVGAFWIALSKPPARHPAQTSPPPPVETLVVDARPTGQIEGSRRAALGDGASFTCSSPKVTDGDTIRCGDIRVRLASIDAPEMPGHCRQGRDCTSGDPFSSKANLERLVREGVVVCRQTDTDRYGRAVAFCTAGGRDLSCAQVQSRHAVVRYGGLNCRE